MATPVTTRYGLTATPDGLLSGMTARIPWGGTGAAPGCRVGGTDAQHAGHRSDRRPLRRRLRAHLGDHAHRTLTKLIGILPRTTDNSNLPKGRESPEMPGGLNVSETTHFGFGASAEAFALC